MNTLCAPLHACSPAAQNGPISSPPKVGKMTKKVHFFKVFHVVTIIEPRQKRHQTPGYFGPKNVLGPLALSLRMQMLKIPNFCAYPRDSASGPKTFFGPK